jgi:2-iminobutanoate/2-iminopropanoate deaminase
MRTKVLALSALVMGLSSGVVSPNLTAAPKKLIHPKEFAKGRPFSPGIMVGDTLYVAGQTGQDLKTGAIPDDFEAEVKQTLDNIGLVLKEAGLSFDHAVAVNVYLTDMELFARMNAVYVPYFKEPRPVRATVGVAKLVGKARIEITLTASK